MKECVAVTDLFPLANQCPRQAIRPHTDQPEAEHIDSFFLSRTIFSNPFLKARQVRERTQLVVKTNPLVSSATDIPHEYFH